MTGAFGILATRRDCSPIGSLFPLTFGQSIGWSLQWPLRFGSSARIYASVTERQIETGSAY